MIFEELLNEEDDFGRCMLSRDGRILLNGRIIIQLDEDLMNVADIGVLSFEKIH